MSEKLEPHDLIRLVRLGMKPDLFDDPGALFMLPYFTDCIKLISLRYRLFG